MKKRVKITYMMFSKDWNAFIRSYERWSTEEITEANENFITKYSVGKAWYSKVLDNAIKALDIT